VTGEIETGAARSLGGCSSGSDRDHWAVGAGEAKKDRKRLKMNNIDRKMVLGFG